MFVGHVAAGLAAKRVAPRVSTAVLLAAPLLVDLLWPIFLLLGVEHARPDPGNTAYTPIAFLVYPVTHSLLTGFGWAVLAGVVYRLATQDDRGTIVVGALVISHWIFDWIVHRPDLPLYPGSRPYGLGLWNSVPATLLVEGSLFIGGILVYLRATRARGIPGRLSFWLLITLLALITAGNLAGPPPPSERALAVFSLALWLIPLWGLWIERTREPVS